MSALPATGSAPVLPSTGSAVARPVPAVDPGESRRLEALEQLQLLGTGREERFDRITRLAQRVFDVPIATVTLIAEDHLWFKSAQGMPVDRADRQASFCDRTMVLRGTHVVPDALQDPVFATAPAVCGPPNVRFYAGHPLTGPGGMVIGTLCLFDTRPRTLDTRGVAVLEELARWTEEELATSADMERAREVQAALLPDRPPEVPGYAIAGTCRPAAAVGGDLLDLDVVDGDLVVTLADVMGKGAGAAILMATVRAVLRAASRGDTPGAAADRPESAVLAAAARTLQPDLARAGSFVTCFTGRLEAATGRLRYADAGHGLAVVHRADGSTQHLAGEDLPLGVEADLPWAAHELVLDPGDTLLVFSDGLFDVLGGTREALEHVARLVRAHPDPETLLDQVRGLTAAARPLDDVTAIALRRLATS
ncbi:PP2C family protein-serine/threonine phosphatase [Geodermatophilus amargosae]|uniref:PP2C family protein-serine/threonine phosphatase n=1 Tax=Geodermatophilus amargosae TaxID=1296565 RepID=UPI0034E033CD